MSFDDHVKAALDSLPADIASALENIVVVIEDEHPEDPDLYGLYEGIPFPSAATWRVSCLTGSRSFAFHSRRSFADPAELEREIRITVLHEIGHYFGLDEDRLAELGYD